jgi:hypothetical protein
LAVVFGATSCLVVLGLFVLWQVWPEGAKQGVSDEQIVLRGVLGAAVALFAFSAITVAVALRLAGLHRQTRARIAQERKLAEERQSSRRADPSGAEPQSGGDER